MMFECLVTMTLQAWTGEAYQAVKCYECRSEYEVKYQCDRQVVMVEVEGTKFWITID